MNTILDYLEWRGDLSFNERPFNEIDNLIFSELAYFQFSDVMEPEETITISDVFSRNKIKPSKHDYSSNDPLPLLEACSKSVRFSNVSVTNFVEIMDTKREIQFSATTFIYAKDQIYVAYRGTDSNIVGWREDFNLSFLAECPAQAEAVNYLHKVLKSFSSSIIVGGHSKGGNLAIYASIFCKPKEQNRITSIYSNDGPGFNEYISSDKRYKAILPKVNLIIPEASIIGILFSNKEDKKIVKSTANGGHQHNPYTWVVKRDSFEEADKQASSSVLLDSTMELWLKSLTDKQKKIFVNSLFNSIEASGATTLAQINDQKWVSYNAIIKALKEMDSESKDCISNSIKKLALAGRDVLWNETKKKFEPRH